MTKLLPGMQVPLLEFDMKEGWQEAILSNPDGTDGVRFSIMHLPTCYRRGPYKLLIEVLGTEYHNNWGCFDEQDQPARWYHSGAVAVVEATAIANVLMENFVFGKEKKELDMAHLHKSRQMFAFHEGKILLAEIGDRRSHEEWFKSFSPPIPYDTTPRGFVRGTMVAIYVGPYFNIPQNWEQVARALETVLPKSVYDVLLGMEMAAPGEKWKPRSVLLKGLKTSSGYVRVHLTHSYISPDKADVIEMAKDAICDDMKLRNELRAKIEVEPAPTATEVEVPEFLIEFADRE